MTSEIEKSPREIAEAFVEKWQNYANSIDAVEQLLISRDERAAKIAEAMCPSGGRMWTGEQAACFEALSARAVAIRGASSRTKSASDTFHCENCECDFTDHPHATDDGYWLCNPCWRGLNAEQGICECRCHDYHEVRAATCQHCS